MSTEGKVSPDYFSRSQVVEARVDLTKLFSLTDDSVPYSPYLLLTDDLGLSWLSHQQFARGFVPELPERQVAEFWKSVTMSQRMREENVRPLTPMTVHLLRRLVDYCVEELKKHPPMTDGKRDILAMRLSTVRQRLAYIDDEIFASLGNVENPARSMSGAKVVDLVFQLNDAIAEFRTLNNDFISKDHTVRVQREMVIAGLKQILAFLGDGDAPPEKINRNTALSTKQILEKANQAEETISMTKRLLENMLAIIRLFI